MPMHICTSVDGPLGNCTFHSPWPITRGALQTQITYETSTASIARADDAVHPGRQLVDRHGGFRVISDTEAEDGGVAQPEGQTGDEADFRNLDCIKSVHRIDAVTHSTPGEYGGADIVADRVAGETGQRRDAIWNFIASNGSQRKQVVEGERKIATGHKKGSGRDVVRLRCLQRRNHLVGVNVAQHV